MIRTCALWVTAAYALTAFAAEGATPVPKALADRLLATYVFVGGGSGVLIGTDGLILTNNHVIDGLRDYTVRTADSTTYQATLLGTDPVGDIALLKIDPAMRPGGGSFPGAELAPLTALLPGSEVIAIGNPFALGDLDDVPSLSTGVLSCGRIVRGDYSDSVQSDAPVNPGNSGGPLFDRNGLLLGINGQIRSLSGYRINSGIGLAIASTQLAAFLPELVAADGGYVRHTAAPKGLELASDADGVFVKKTGDSPLLVGDRLMTIAGRAVASVPTAMGLFASLPARAGAGTTVLVARSDGQSTELVVPLSHTPIPGNPYHGLSFVERDGTTIIGHVDQNSPASSAGFTVGSQVLSIEGKPITTKVSLLRALVGREIGDRVEFTTRDRAGTDKTAKVLFKQHP
ncbi:MAG: trypsin-like peptidase domain-containing protein [Planctomycetes bacterium]|nr:trypsin-like peptidase domain-containing protein [Planctomycetota bacterium]